MTVSGFRWFSDPDQCRICFGINGVMPQVSRESVGSLHHVQCRCAWENTVLVKRRRVDTSRAQVSCWVSPPPIGPVQLCPRVQYSAAVTLWGSGTQTVKYSKSLSKHALTNCVTQVELPMVHLYTCAVCEEHLESRCASCWLSNSVSLCLSTYCIFCTLCL